MLQPIFRWGKILFNRFLPFGLAWVIVCAIAVQPAWASANDDRFDGNIFALYAGNGSLVPAKTTLSEAFDRSRVALLVYFLDDSKDCKQFVSVISQLQRYYGMAADFIPVNVDTLASTASNNPTDPRYYYQGYIPQTVLIDQSGNVVLDQTGQVSFETLDDQLREVFDLLPRTESVELKRRSFNEFNDELVSPE